MNTGPLNAIWIDRYTLVTLHDAIKPYRTQPIYTVEFREFTPPDMLEIGNPAETHRMIEVVDVGEDEDGDRRLHVISPDAKSVETIKAIQAVQRAEIEFDAIKKGDTVPVADLNLVEHTF